MKVVIKLRSGVTDVNGKELVSVYIIRDDGLRRNKRYFSHIESAYKVARLEAKRNSCIIVGYV